MSDLLVQQWGAVLQKMETETSRYMSRYHYFFGYSGAFLAFALGAVGVPHATGYGVGDDRLLPPAVVVSVACLISAGAAVAALVMVNQYISTRWLWRDALREIEEGIRNGQQRDFLEPAAGNGGLFFSAYSHLGAWAANHDPLPTERSMRIVAQVWLGFTALLFLGSLGYLICRLACS